MFHLLYFFQPPLLSGLCRLADLANTPCSLFPDAVLPSVHRTRTPLGGTYGPGSPAAMAVAGLAGRGRANERITGVLLLHACWTVAPRPRGGIDRHACGVSAQGCLSGPLLGGTGRDPLCPAYRRQRQIEDNPQRPHAACAVWLPTVCAQWDCGGRRRRLQPWPILYVHGGVSDDARVFQTDVFFMRDIYSTGLQRLERAHTHGLTKRGRGLSH